MVWYFGKAREEKKNQPKSNFKNIEQSESHIYEAGVYMASLWAVVTQVSFTQLSSLWLLNPEHFSDR